MDQNTWNNLNQETLDYYRSNGWYSPSQVPRYSDAPQPKSQAQLRQEAAERSEKLKIQKKLDKIRADVAKEDELRRKQLLREQEARNKAAYDRRSSSMRISAHALNQLKIPQPIRQAARFLGDQSFGSTEWQLQQRGAGFSLAPPTPPLDWDRMSASQRNNIRGSWR